MAKKKAKRLKTGDVTLQEQRSLEEEYRQLVAHPGSVRDGLQSVFGASDAALQETDASDLLELAAQQMMRDVDPNELVWRRMTGPTAAQSRAHEEASLRSVGFEDGQIACCNSTKEPSCCVANTIFWPLERGLQMARFEPEGASSRENGKSGGGDEGPCLLCLRFHVQRTYYVNVQLGVSLRKDAILTDHRNIVDVPGEYASEDCLHPLSAHCGTLGPIVRLQRNKYRLQTEHRGTQKLYRVVQLHRVVDQRVPDF